MTGQLMNFLYMFFMSVCVKICVLHLYMQDKCLGLVLETSQN